MMRRVATILIAAAAAAAVILGALALYRHFVTDRVVDRGGMENPDYVEQIQKEE